MSLSADRSISAAPSQTPLRFDANATQSGNGVGFTVQDSNTQVAVSATEASFTINQSTTSYGPWQKIQLQMIGGDANAVAAGSDLQTDSNGTVTYSAVSYSNVWNGVDVRYYGNPQNQFEYDLTVNPGDSVSQIQIGVNGAESLSLNQDGSLSLQTASGNSLVEQAPVIYQTINGARQSVSGDYSLIGNNLIGFSIRAYNHAVPLVIDPSSITSLGSSANPSTSGQAVTFNAMVSGMSGIPTGTVSFYDGNTWLSNGTLSGGMTSFTTSTLTVGTHNIVAIYGGDSVYDPSTSNNLVQTVNQGGSGGGTGGSSSTPTIEASESLITAGDTVTYSILSSTTYSSVQWDFNYDCQNFQADPNYSGASVNYIMSAVGSQTIAAQVTDSSGNQQVITLDVEVDSDLSVQGADSGTAGQAVSFNVVSASGADLSTDTINWDFNYDGSNFVADPSASGASASATYMSPGSYVAAAQIFDSSGNSQIVTFNETITSPYSIQASSQQVTQGSTVSFSVVSSTDPSPTFTSVLWDFNYDGSNFVADQSASGANVSGAMSVVGSPTVAAEVTDSSGITQIITFSVEVDSRVLDPIQQRLHPARRHGHVQFGLVGHSSRPTLPSNGTSTTIARISWPIPARAAQRDHHAEQCRNPNRRGADHRRRREQSDCHARCHRRRQFLR